MTVLDVCIIIITLLYGINTLMNTLESCVKIAQMSDDTPEMSEAAKRMYC